MPKLKKYTLLVHMPMKASGSRYEEVELKKDGNWSPTAVFCNVYLADMVSVETKIEVDEW